MNWTDIVVLTIILGFGYFGLKKGIMFSLFKFTSFFIAIIVAVKFSHLLAGILSATFIFPTVKTIIFDKMMLQQEEQMAAANEGASATAESVIDGLKLPEFIKNFISDKVVGNMPDVGGIIDYASIVDKISDVLANFVISIMSVILLYIIARIALIFARSILEKMTRLPVLRQVDKLGGFALGIGQGLLIVYAVFAVLMLFNATSLFGGIFDSIEASRVAKYFYENNVIISLMVPKG